MNENYLRFNKLLAILSTKTKNGINISYKNESLLMKLFGKLLFFNNDFMTNYTTTIGNTIYFPTRESVEKSSNDDNLVILSHEFVHIKDSESLGSLAFKSLYLSPQIFSILFAIILTVLFKWYIGLFVFLLLLSPIPSFGRKYLELRAYKTNLYSLVRILQQQKRPEEVIVSKQAEACSFINKQFTSFSYYYCWPFGVMSDLSKTILSINSNEFIKTDDIYTELSEAYDELYKII